jgi:hypothetical protein
MIELHDDDHRDDSIERTGIEFEPGNIIGYLMPIEAEFDVLQALRDAREAQIAGTPWVNQFFWDFQDLSYNCTAAVQYCILQAFGIEATEAEVTQLALEQGWLTESGGSFSDLGKVLEYYGVETHSNVNGTIEDVIAELCQGHAVIVPVDAGELWADTFLERLWEWMEDVLGIPDHVVWITGVDMSDPDNPQVIVNDTGAPDGAGQRYPLSEFIDAWEDHNFAYIATNEAPPDYDAYVALEELIRGAS